MFSIFFDVFKEQKGFIILKGNELAVRVMDVRKDLMIYAPDSIVKKFFDWNNFTSMNPTNLNHVTIFLDLFILIRQDMGHKPTKIRPEEILRVIMTNEDEYRKLKVELI